MLSIITDVFAAPVTIGLMPGDGASLDLCVNRIRQNTAQKDDLMLIAGRSVLSVFLEIHAHNFRFNLANKADPPQVDVFIVSAAAKLLFSRR